MEKFKGYDVVNSYPENGWLKGYFYAQQDDIKNNRSKSTKAYRDLDSIKHRDYILHLLGVNRQDKVLDVGCADGAMMVYSGLLGAEVYGLDISSEAIEKANKYLKEYTLRGKAIVGDARKISFPENYFDKAISSDFFEHMSVEDNMQVLREIKRVLKPDGIAIIKTPNLTYLRFARFYKMIKRALRLKNPFDVVIAHTTEENHQHIGLLTKSKMIKIIKSAGFMNFKFYYDSNSKIERTNYITGELLSRIPLLRDIFTEDLIVVIHKPIILSFFP